MINQLNYDFSGSVQHLSIEQSKLPNHYWRSGDTLSTKITPFPQSIHRSIKIQSEIKATGAGWLDALVHRRNIRF